MSGLIPDMAVNKVQKVLVGKQPRGEIRVALSEHITADVAKAQLLEHMPPEKAAETVWTVEERTLR